MVNSNGINFTPVGDACKETGIALGFTVLILLSSALQFYKQNVLQHTPPVAFAAMTKTTMGVMFLIFIIGKSLTAEGVTPLFAHDRYISPWWLTVFITLLCVFGAVTLALDTMAFVYLDLATKQVIDSMSPVAVWAVGFPLMALLNRCRPQMYIVFNVDDDLETERRGRGWRKTKLAQVVFMFLMVVSSVFVVWVTPSVSFTGVVINGSTLFTSAVGIIVLETLLKWRAYSKFGLMVVTILPEIMVLTAMSIALGEKLPGYIYVAHAAGVAAVEVVLKVVAFYLLRVTSSVELTVAGVMVFVIVVTLDTLKTGKAGTMRVVGLSCTGLFLGLYTLMGYMWRRREMRIQVLQQLGKELGECGEGLPFDSSDDIDLSGRHGDLGPDFDLGLGQVFRKTLERRVSVGNLSSSGYTEYSETDLTGRSE